MFDLIRKILQTKTVTKTHLFDEAPQRYQGKPIFTTNECTGCESCVTECPANAIEIHKTGSSITLSLSNANCIFCGICAEQCETKMIQVTNEYRLATRDKETLTSTITIPIKTTELLTTGKGG
ncbi:4Fe-4S binding protein [Neobacillus sp. PS3-12]|uniref:4Fe-4S binding protein n=1 Tax=Neobacillus sp. PS3-12 TaxID=3070677 RepID=UPI0027DEEF06|nr:4Fe-4S binding protein [Neobacillus sp. PS3-12]WML52656.1 4Fe-4S binding protein [Neobacillus sp. PS3-12]